MPKENRLTTRGTTYWFRAMVPADIRDTYGKREETCSLRTKCLKEAKRLVRQKSVEIDTKFDDHRKSLKTLPPPEYNDYRTAHPAVNHLSTTAIRARADAHYRKIREDDFAWRVNFRQRFNDGTFELPDDSILYNRVIENGGTEDQILSYCMARERKRQLREAKRASHLGDVSGYEHLVNGDVDGADRIKLLGALIDAEVRALTFILRNLPAIDLRTPESRALEESDPLRIVGPIPQETAAGGPEPATKQALLSAVVCEWVAEHSRGSWTPKTVAAMEAILNQFVDVVGDKPVGAVTKKDCRSFKSTLMKLPPNVSKLKGLRTLPIKEGADRAAKDGLKPMALTNVNKNVTRVASFFRWAQKHYDSVKFNPAEGMTVKKRTAAKDDRDSFTAEELAKIFNAPIYRSDKMRETAKFWVPLIGLATGARLGEIVQLHTADIKRKDGVDFIDICAGGEGDNTKSMKTTSSVRQIPIHPLLAEMGFLDFVAIRRKNGDLRLFPDYKRSADNSWSAAFSKHFGRRLKSVGAKTTKNAFHSFRHNFEDFAKNSGVDIPRIDALMGHAAPGMGGRYGDGYDLKSRNDAIRKIKFDGVDLAHLRP